MKNEHIKKKITELVQDRIKAHDTGDKTGVSTPDEDPADSMETERADISEGMTNRVVGGGRSGSPTPPHAINDMGAGGIWQ